MKTDIRIRSKPWRRNCLHGAAHQPIGYHLLSQSRNDLPYTVTIPEILKMSTANRQIFTISELLTNLSIFEPIQTRPASSYCHIWTFGFPNFHNTALLRRGGEIPQGVLAAVFFGDVFQTYFHRGLLTCSGSPRREGTTAVLRQQKHPFSV